jgi:hypothetical protein
MNSGVSALSGKKIALLAAILFAAFALRLWNLGTQSLWHDEAWSVFSAYHPLAWGELGTDPNAPPIFYMTLSVWQHLVGDSVWAMRLWSALIGVILVAVAARLVGRWFGTEAAALGALLLSFCPILWVFSQEIRAYIVMPLCALILLALANAILAPTASRRTWFWVAIVELITLYAHNLSVPIVAWLSLVVGLAWALRHDFRRLGQWILMQAGVGILYLPWLLTQRPTGTALNTPPTLNLALLGAIWESYFTGIKTLLGADSPITALSVAVLILGIVPIIWLIIHYLRKVAHPEAQPYFLLLSQAVLIPLLSLIEILGAHIDFHPRYFIVGAPAALLAIAVAVAKLPRREHRTIRTGIGILRAALPVLMIAAMLRMMEVVYSNPIYQHDDFRSIALHYAALGPDDRVIIPYGWEPTLDYYGQKLGFTDKLIGIPLHDSADDLKTRLASLLTSAKRVEFLTWYQLPADVRGAYACLLGAVGHHTDSMTVAGVKSDAYDTLTALDSIPLQDDTNRQVRFDSLDYAGGAGIWGSGGLCLTTRWALPQPTAHPLRLSARLHNPLDWTLGAQDTDLLNDLGVPTPFWHPGETATAYTFMALPAALPCATYPIGLTLYTAEQPQGIEPQIATGNGWQIDHTRELKIGTIDKPAIAGSQTASLTSSDLPKTLTQGQELRLSLTWPTPPGATDTLNLQGDGWSVTSQFTFRCAQSPVIAWHDLVVPADAKGNATLKTGDTILATYTIAAIDRTFTPPTAIPIPANATFRGVGTLIGLDASGPITLYWRADATPDRAYKVFVHLLDSDGQIVAQDDSEPLEGARPTTNWLKGEYLTDPHPLSAFDRARVASLRIGLYDPATGQRVVLADGSDSYTVRLK